MHLINKGGKTQRMKHIITLKKQQNIFINESIKHFLNGSISAKHFTYYLYICILSFEYLSNYTSIHRNVLNSHISIFSLENIIIKV